MAKKIKAFVFPRPFFTSKGTRVLRRMIRHVGGHEQKKTALREQARMALKQKRHAERKAVCAAHRLQRELNGNQGRSARPKRGSLKDRENSDPSDAEKEEILFLNPQRPSTNEAARVLLSLAQ